MPRGHLKTTVSSVLRILHTLYVNPNVRIFIGCLSKSLSNSIMREVQAFLLDDWNQENVWNNRPHIQGRLIPVMDKLGKQRRYQRKYEEETWAEDKKIIWRSDAIQVIRNGTILKEPSVVVGSVESSATGHHYDELVFDDIINFSNYNTPNKQQSIDRWLGDMESVLDPEYFDEELYEQLCRVTDSQKYREIFQKICHIGNKISIVGTLYFKDDLYDRISKANEADLENGHKPEYHVFKRNIYANGVDNTDGYLWVEKWNEDLEKQKRKSINMTSEIWASQYLNMIISPESKCLQWEKVRFIHP